MATPTILRPSVALVFVSLLFAITDSRAASVTVNPPPTILTQPADVLTPVSSAFTLTVATADSEVSYQWYLGATGNVSSPILGATQARLGGTAAEYYGSVSRYWVRLTNAFGFTDSRTVTVTADFPRQAPVILIYRTGYWGAVGSVVTLDVTTTFSPWGQVLTYQWYHGEKGDTSQPVARRHHRWC